MSSMILLSSSSFFLPTYLTKQIKDNNYSRGQFSFALKKSYVIALIIQEKQADLGSNNWIALNRELAKTQWLSALKLARWYQGKSKNESRELLFSKAIMWFEQAIRLGSQQAIVALAQLYFQQNKMIKAQATLRQLPEVIPGNNVSEAALILDIIIAIHLGDSTQVKQLLNSSTAVGFQQSNMLNLLLADIDKYAISNFSTMLKDVEDVKVNLSSPSCISSLQLFATNLKHLKHLEQLIQTFNTQQPLAQYVCLSTPRYISIKRLDCMAQSQHTITCDETLWRTVAEDVDSRHIGLMLNEGKANVHFGILYFDANDNAEVFSHEVSHLLGFVDEYPLIKGHNKCQGIQSKPFSHNIAVLKKYYQGDKKELRAKILKNVSWANSINANTPILQVIDKTPDIENIWLLGTPLEYKDKIGIYISESCQKSNSDYSDLPRRTTSINQVTRYSAFKPLSRRTQLRYFANDFPKEYLTLIKENPSDYFMPSFHYNIALALYQQGEVSNAKYWLSQAAQWENNLMRKARVLKGEL